ncbi:hypothetical protein AB6V43_08650, partial [Stenotrophomonas maltophilia]
MDQVVRCRHRLHGGWLTFRGLYTGPLTHSRGGNMSKETIIVPVVQATIQRSEYVTISDSFP